MASLLPHYAYDIFVSYRHNDNKDGWVTNFVSALQQELAATVKEPLSVYVDHNPQDGLLDTHDVDQSLAGKLKCLIFIPILSQTYCDQNSFAWRHEFCAFNKMAPQDALGREVKLANGNVASRILPIKIHDLDPEDKSAFEQELGRALRAIDFIHKSAGVNRPLESKDDDVRTAGKVLYRDQINKVAHAIKDIVQALKHPATASPAADKQASTLRASTPQRSLKPVWIAASVAVAAALALYFAYPKFKPAPQSAAQVVKSIAVLPFVDMSPNKDQEYFADGLSEELLNKLANVSELQVTGRTSSFAFKGKNEDIRKIGETLGVAHVLEGSVRREGARVRITAQLIRTADGFHLWSETYDRSANDHFAVQTEIADKVTAALNVVMDAAERERMRATGVRNIEAFIAYQKAMSLFSAAHDPSNPGRTFEKLHTANREFDRATELEPGFADAWYRSSDLYGHRLRDAPLTDAEWREAIDQARQRVGEAVRHATNPQQRAAYALDQQLLSNNWHGLDARSRDFSNMQGCTATNWGGVAHSFGFAREMAAYAERITRCDPLMQTSWENLSYAQLSMNDPQAVLDNASRMPASIAASPSMQWLQSKALAALGRLGEARALQSGWESDIYYALDVAIFTTVAEGRDLSKLRTQLQPQSHSNQAQGYGGILLNELRLNQLAGDLAANDRIVAKIDARPNSAMSLAGIIELCGCGALWHLDATPNFRARLKEANFRWPPADVPIKNIAH